MKLTAKGATVDFKFRLETVKTDGKTIYQPVKRPEHAKVTVNGKTHVVDFVLSAARSKVAASDA